MAVLSIKKTRHDNALAFPQAVATPIFNA